MDVYLVSLSAGIDHNSWLAHAVERSLVTSIAVWPGVDSRGISSLYVASDSRITWGDGQTWDQGRKVFASGLKPHIFGYCGDVLFPALALPVLVDRVDRGLLASEDKDTHIEIMQAVRSLWNGYPASPRQDFKIIHGLRVGTGMGSVFSLAVMKYTAGTDRWAVRRIPMPAKSTLLLSEGSGAGVVRKSYQSYQSYQSRQRGRSADTSRAVFSAFCEAITSSDDRNSGGAAQLAGLYRIGGGRLFGTVHAGRRNFTGATLIGSEKPDGVEWRNNLFERVAGTTKRRLPGAQRHDTE